MPSQPSFWKFVGFCSVFMGIVLFCIVAGGYTNFYRSENQIEATKAYLTDACQERLDLLPGLIEMSKKTLPQFSSLEIDLAAEVATNILQQVTAEEKLLEMNLINNFEISQSKLTRHLKELFIQLEAYPNKAPQFNQVKKQFIFAQNNLFVSKKRYNDKVSYYNDRKSAFFISLIAKLFGFDKINYTEISNEPFLPAHEVFETGTS